MINEKLYNKTVQILFDAYFNDTLKHGDCSACAIGNLCLAAGNPLIKVENPYDRVSDEDFCTSNSAWKAFFCTSDKEQEVHPNGNDLFSKENLSNARRVALSTGYSIKELAKIEYAFELANNEKGTDKEMFDGLCNVLAVLKEIHQVEDDEPVRQKFTNYYQTLTLK